MKITKLQKSKIPEFNSVKEEALFWDTHSFADFMDETRKVEISYTPKRKDIGLNQNITLPVAKNAIDAGYTKDS